MTKKLHEYIFGQEKSRKRRQNTLHGRDIVTVVNSLPPNVSVDSVLRKIEVIYPPALLSELDMIYIGDFEVLKKRELQGLYYNGTVYITNEQDNDDDLFDDLVHELSHAIESALKANIYGDGEIETEFETKRLQLYDLLASHGYEPDKNLFLNTKFSSKLDNFLYKEVGYDTIQYIAAGIFVSSYSATSLREYWAKGVEEYLLKDRKYLQQVSPTLYYKIDLLFSK
jgi:hypothetical protein